MGLEELKDQKICVGVKQTTKAILNGQVKKIYIANDTDIYVIRQLIQLAKDHGIPIEDVESKSELGRACRIEIGAATAALLK